jgi:hypothetical protein
MKPGSGALVPGGPLSSPVPAVPEETLEAAYAAWDAAREERVRAQSRARAERERLQVEGRFLVGAARAAAGMQAPAVDGGQPALVAAAGLEALVAEAESRVSSGRAALEAQLAEELSRCERTCAEAEAEVISRVARYAAGASVPVKLMLRPVGTSRAVLHLGRLSPDESVLLFHLLTGAVPSRHRFLEDEATEDLSLGAPPLYPDAGVAAEEIRPMPASLAERLSAGGAVLPVRGFIPVRLPSDGGHARFRFLQRGPVLELEQLHEGAFISVLPLEQAEQVTGLLLRLRVEGRLLLDVRSG